MEFVLLFCFLFFLFDTLGTYIVNASFAYWAVCHLVFRIPLLTFTWRTAMFNLELSGSDKPLGKYKIRQNCLFHFNSCLRLPRLHGIWMLLQLKVSKMSGWIHTVVLVRPQSAMKFHTGCIWLDKHNPFNLNPVLEVLMSNVEVFLIYLRFSYFLLHCIYLTALATH